MPQFLRSLLHFLFRLGYFGPFFMGILDSSFLFLPFGNDLLVVVLAARRHEAFLLYVLSATAGSLAGVALLDLVARKLGEERIAKVAGRRQFDYLKRRVGQHGGKAIILGSLAPPPFPFTMAVAVNSALGYPRQRLFLLVGVGRALRFLILALLAMKFGRSIIHVLDSDSFRAFMYAVTAVCIAGSTVSIVNWVRKSRTGNPPPSSEQPAKA